MQSVFVDILTNDDRFGRMLYLELERFGANVFLGDFRVNEKTAETVRFAIVDLDQCANEQLAKIDASCTLIGFSRRSESDLLGLARVCHVFLHRPFSINMLLDIIIGENRQSILSDNYKDHKLSEHAVKNNMLRVNSEKKCAVWGGHEIALSQTEYAVLELLCQKRGELVTRSELDSHLGVDCGNMSDVYICHLRRKLDNKLGLKLIRTVRGRGYLLNN